MRDPFQPYWTLTDPWRRVAGQFDVEAAEPVPILSGRRHLVRQLTDKLAATPIWRDKLAATASNDPLPGTVPAAD